KDVPADQVVDIIFQQKALDMRKNGNVILIAPRDEIATKEKLEFESKQQISNLEPIKLESIGLNYLKAENVVKLLLGSGGDNGTRILSKRGSVSSESTSNKIFVNDTPAKLDEIRGLIKTIDVGSRQVMIEARVVEANDSFNRDLGAKVNFLNTTNQRVAGSGVYVGGGSYSPVGQVANKVVDVNLPAYSNAGGALSFSLFNQAFSRILNVELAALEADGAGKVVSSPRVLTINNVKAIIKDGTQVPIAIPGKNGEAPAPSFKDATLTLEATPQITPDGTIKMKLLIRKDDADYTRTDVYGNPAIKTSVVETEVVVENGGTIVIGGVYKTENAANNQKVPFLGDLWGIGWLFKVNSKDSTRRELLVFITPKVLDERLNFR
ncbi:MAG: type IV pilus secretin PilQ, partial [Rhodocyclaceae bacterium]|nr:type IV pilus secretin PilQ [Rhodocyclaceae bacterium]